MSNNYFQEPINHRRLKIFIENQSQKFCFIFFHDLFKYFSSLKYDKVHKPELGHLSYKGSSKIFTYLCTDIQMSNLKGAIQKVQQLQGGALLQR